TSEVVSRSVPSAAPAFGQESLSALEERMTALFNTAGKDTAERLARLEETLSQRRDRPDHLDASSAPKTPSDRRLKERLQALSESRAPAVSDRMPANPAEEAPLVDPGFG